MSLTSRILAGLMHLPPAETHNIAITRNIEVPMPDGVVLLADHYAPRRTRGRPTILVRTPYGRGGLFGSLYARPFAERGYQVLIQSCRGTDGSGGQFAYVRHEHEDGLATIAWIKRQPWFAGNLAMTGVSYLGFVQWAVAADAGSDLKALVPQMTTSDGNHHRFPSGSFTLETSLDWSTMMTEQAATGLRLGLGSLLSQQRRRRKIEDAFLSLPLAKADVATIGRPSAIFQSVLAHGPDDPYWDPVDFSNRVSEVVPPVSLMAGWYDLFLDWQLKDYQKLRAAGRQPHLLIGPWVHGQPGSASLMMNGTLAWLDAHLRNDRSRLRDAPVRLLVMGTKEWREFADWPPPSTVGCWYLQPRGGLAPSIAPASDPDHYRYDPANPTPSVGGNSLGNPKRMGPKDNRALEARPDVLVYTSAPLEHDLEIIGPVSAELYIHSSLEHTDFFARLCVVETSGKSVNLCDGIVRLPAGESAPVSADGSRHIRIDLWSTAYHFRPGERIRLQVSSGAHPRFARNLGTGEPLGTGTTLRVADQTVYHDPDHPSLIMLPVFHGSAI
jgi:putative CocE/NonD family hydrolase